MGEKPGSTTKGWTKPCVCLMEGSQDLLEVALLECCYAVIVSILKLQDAVHSCLGLAFEASKVEKLTVKSHTNPIC